MPINFSSLASTWFSLVTPFRSKSLWNLGLFSISWSVWLCRNDVIVKGAKVDVNHLFDLCISRFNWWCRAKWPFAVSSISDCIRCPSSISLISIDRPSLPIKHHIGFDPQALIFNVDGVVCGGFGHVGIGGLLRNHLNITLISFSKFAGFFYASSAELLDIKEACSLFSSSPWGKSFSLIVECDCPLVVNWLLHPSRAPFVFKHLIYECLSVCENIKWVINSIPRTENVSGDLLAKKRVCIVLKIQFILLAEWSLGTVVSLLDYSKWRVWSSISCPALRIFEKDRTCCS
ncbi:hypothetical protein V6N11_072856 [Hibiscus sabdariffa]|uniref:RNase H type-1 domain-containing protein n=2 Tax=Hibiscus sabdariffa TaxID=183260 RepID=A0ABR2B2Z9_9ROSI